MRIPFSEVYAYTRFAFQFDLGSLKSAVLPQTFLSLNRRHVETGTCIYICMYVLCMYIESYYICICVTMYYVRTRVYTYRLQSDLTNRWWTGLRWATNAPPHFQNGRRHGPGFHSYTYIILCRPSRAYIMYMYACLRCARVPLAFRNEFLKKNFNWIL